MTKLHILFIDNFNNKLLGTISGLFRLNGLNRDKILIEGFKDESIYKITGDINGNLWLGCNGIIFKVSNNKITQSIILNSKMSEKVTKMFCLIKMAIYGFILLIKDYSC